MSIELKMLAWTALWSIALTLPASTGRMQAAGLAWAFGNRETTPETPAWVGRADRAYKNLLESLVPFAILVILVTVTGKMSSLTALAATAFFWARIVHGASYIFGIIYVRTLAYAVGLAANIALFVALVR